MREISYDLKKYKDITGELILEIPSYRERLKMIKECNFQTDSKGQVVISGEGIDSFIKLLDVTEKYFKKIDVVCGEIKAKTFSELEGSPEFDSLINDCAAFILNAGKLGK
jgi:hypothetical protein